MMGRTVHLGGETGLAACRAAGECDHALWSWAALEWVEDGSSAAVSLQTELLVLESRLFIFIALSGNPWMRV